MDRVKRLSAYLGEGGRGEGYESLQDLVGRMLDGNNGVSDPAHRACVRLTNLFCVAAVEGANEAHGKVDPITIIHQIGIAAGTASIATAISPFVDLLLSDKEALGDVRKTLISAYTLAIDNAVSTWQLPTTKQEGD